MMFVTSKHLPSVPVSELHTQGLNEFCKQQYGVQRTAHCLTLVSVSSQ